MLNYKGFIGEVSFDNDAGILHGRVINLENGDITFQGTSVEEVRKEFQISVDDYLEFSAIAPATPPKLTKIELIAPVGVHDFYEAACKAAVFIFVQTRQLRDEKDVIIPGKDAITFAKALELFEDKNDITPVPNSAGGLGMKKG